MITLCQHIICPECKSTEKAEVICGFPWYTYIHDCKNCGYIIMESEWQLAEEIKTQSNKETQ